MKLLLLAVLLSVMQTAPPVLRQAPDNPTAHGQSINKDSSQNQAPIAPPSVQNTTAPEKDSQSRNGQPKTDAQETIVVRELPPVTVNASSDWWSRAYVVLTGFLVLIGGLGVRFALRTLRAIESQTNAQIESLRARITFASTENTFTAILHDGYVDMRMEFINTGGTPAYKVSPETWIEFLPVNFEDFTENAKYHKGESLAVYPQSPTTYSIPLGRKARNDEIAGLRNAQTTLGVRIRLTYETFGKMCIVDRAFWLTPDGWVFHPKYNEAN
jgi:hypothetical protein